MELNKEKIDLLIFLTKQSSFVKIDDIAKNYKVSSRTIRYRLDEIDAFLDSKNLPKIVRDRNLGVKVIVNEKSEKVFEKFLGSYTPFNYKFSKSERMDFIISELLQCEESLNVSYLMSVLNISKNTVLKELDVIEENIKAFGLKLIRKPRIGISIYGNEINKRALLSKINSKSMNTEDIYTYIATGLSTNKLNTLSFESLFKDIDLKELDEILKSSEKILDKKFSDSAYSSLITHLVIMIKRIKIGESIAYFENTKEEFTNKKEKEACDYIVSEIEKRYLIKIPNAEINYIMLHLLGSAVIEDSDSSDDTLKNIVDEMIDGIAKIYSANLSGIKENLRTDLIIHLRPTINRIKFNLELINPIFSDIKTQYGELMRNTKIVCSKLEKYIGKEINEHELSYIALHFGAALKNSNNNKSLVRCAVVCGSGIGTANILLSKLKEEYLIEIVGTYSAREILELNENQYDIIISSLNIQGIDKDKYIKVNPLLLEKDIERLDEKLLKRKKSKAFFNENILSEIIKVVERNCDIKNIAKLEVELSMLLSNKDESKKLINNKPKPLKYYLNENNILINEKAFDYKEAIHKGIELLKNEGAVNPDYENEVLEKLSEYGPIMVIAPQIALIHSNSMGNVYKTSFSLMTLRQGVSFKSKENDPVKLVITFSSFDGYDHLEAIKDLGELISDSEKVNKILNARSKKEILELL